MSTFRGWFFIVLTGVLFGSLGLCTKYLTTTGVDPFTCAAVPFSITAILALAGRRWVPAPLPWREGMALGAVNAAAPAVLFNLGFNRLPASVVTLLLAVGPIFTMLAAHLIFHDDRFSLRKLAGLAISFGGIGLLAGAPGPVAGALPAMGAVLGGAALSGSTLVWAKHISARHDPRSVLPPMMAGAALLAVAAAVVSGNAPWTIGPDSVQLTVLGIMGVGTILTYWSLLKANQLAPASRTGLMGYVVTLVGVTGGVVLFGEKITAALIGGGALIVLGVSIAGRARRLTAAGSH
jgi:probable blue pigment (indigoidine) exporter